jgi:hypothetical protein
LLTANHQFQQIGNLLTANHQFQQIGNLNGSARAENIDKYLIS